MGLEHAGHAICIHGPFVESAEYDINSRDLSDSILFLPDFGIHLDYDHDLFGDSQGAVPQLQVSVCGLTLVGRPFGDYEVSACDISRLGKFYCALIGARTRLPTPP